VFGLRIVQLSDFHYAPTAEADQGLEIAGRKLRDLAPDLIIVSGDLTREGLFEQFVPVVEFLSGFGMSRVRAIPGNRDYLFGGPAPVLPKDSDLNYFLTAPDTVDSGANGTAERRSTPFLEFFDDVDFFERSKTLALVGLDSEPNIPDESLTRGLAFFEGSSPKLTRLFCTHRSLLPIPRKKLKEGDVLVNAGDILAQLLAARVDLVLCAHLHRVHAWQLSDGNATMAIINAPSLLDRSPGKENGLLSIDVARRGEFSVTLHPLDDLPPRTLLELPGAGKRRRKG
jgi:3',5'-cyclic AMP phosphodiesterase CpdA